LAARGLQRQRADGDAAAFVGHLRTGLAVARNLTNHATYGGAATGREVERYMLVALEHWLEGPGVRPDLMRDALEAVREHAAAAPKDETVHAKAEYLIARDALDSAGEWMGTFGSVVLGLGSRESDAEVVSSALALPWERARRERLLRVWFWAGAQPPALALPEMHLLLVNGRRVRDRWGGRDRVDAGRAAAQLVLALRLHQAETGRPAESLAALVPAYLPVVPSDPFGGGPFRYRLSKGEAISWPTREVGGQGESMRLVAAGEGVLWSAGEDGRDDGAARQGRPPDDSGAASAGEDLIWLVPPAAKK
jgi:hypothetical protein